MGVTRIALVFKGTLGGFDSVKNTVRTRQQFLRDGYIRTLCLHRKKIRTTLVLILQ